MSAGDVIQDRGVLARVEFLRLLPPELRDLVERTFVPVSVPFGAPIVKEGEEADALYVLASGRARVVKCGDGGNEISLNTLRAGDTFGEMAFLERTARTATVRASTDATVLRLHRTVLEALLQTHPELGDYLSLQARHRHLHNFFRQYTAFTRLPVAALRMMLAEIAIAHVEPGTAVVREGDDAGPMYIVEDGRLRVFTGAGSRSTSRRRSFPPRCSRRRR